MAVTDDIMNDMVAEDQPLVPRVDKFVGTKRAGYGDDNLPIFKSDEQANHFLEGFGILNPTVEMTRGVKMMTEGDIGWGIATTIGGAAGSGTVRGILKGVKAASMPAIKALGEMFRKSPKVLEDIYGGVSTTTEQGAKLASDAASKAELSRRLKKGTRTMDQDHVEGLIQAENMKAARAKARRNPMYDMKGERPPKELEMIKRKGEMRSAIYKAEEFFQRTKLDPKLEQEFVRQAKIGSRSPVSNDANIGKRAADFRRNWLLDEAVEKGALTGKEAEIYRSIGFPQYHSPSKGYEIYNELRPMQAIKEIRNQVRQSLHAEDMNKYISTEITPSGVKARVTPLVDPIDLLPK